MNAVKPQRRRYFILFRHAKFPIRLARFLDSRFTHVSVIEALPYPRRGLAYVDFFIHTEMGYGVISQEILWSAPEPEIAKLLSKRAITAVAAIDVEKKYDRRYISFGVFTCVSLVKSLLGVRAWWVQTPKQLLRFLEKSGADVTWAM